MTKLLIILMLFSFSVFGQEYEYGELKVNKKPKGTYVFFHGDTDKATIIPFKTLHQTLNYLASQGWEYVDVYTIDWQLGTIYYYILRKEK